MFRAPTVVRDAMSPHRRRLPISTRHAFALAFDLAVRRDPLHSLVVPLLLRAPWIVAAALLPNADEVSEGAVQIARWTALVLFGDAVTSLLVAGMLRFRARSVFNTPPSTAPGPVLASYGWSLARLPWLFVTEFARNLTFVLANLFLVLPGVYLGFKLSLATEIVVLRRVSLAEAFATSFRLTEGRFERWLELLALSVVVVLTACFIPVVLFFALPSVAWTQALALGLFLVAAIMPLIQYAWTFFYLRLEEVEPSPLPSSGVPPDLAAAERRMPIASGDAPATAPAEPATRA